tara:strand:+ start:2806 stop:3264 length:459 start_codon:yes stop_codon:yes gene_type:complete
MFKIALLDTPWVFLISEFLMTKDIINLSYINKHKYMNKFSYAVTNEIINRVYNVFTYYETHFSVPFLVKRRTRLHVLKMDFIYQNFYIFTKKPYIYYFKINNIIIQSLYHLNYKKIKKIFKYYCSLVNKNYSKKILFDALKFNNISLLQLIQ